MGDLIFEAAWVMTLVFSTPANLGWLFRTVLAKTTGREGDNH